MHFIRGVAAMLSMTVTALAVWIPLTWWLIRLLWTRGEALSQLKKNMDKVILWWTGSNRRMIKLLGLTHPVITWHDKDQMSDENWYLVISNHQSWVDIVLLQSYLYGTIPPLKFFTKQQLIWVPSIGLAMYVLGFPYVKRVTKAQIKANPKLKTADRDNVAQACVGFKNHPTSILNFIEGTRRTAEKLSKQADDYQYLLRPKVGGLGYVVEGMHGHLHKLLDVTIIYPSGAPTLWEFLQGKCKTVEIEVTPHQIPTTIVDTQGKLQRVELAQWIKTIWLAKDARIIARMSTARMSTAT